MEKQDPGWDEPPDEAKRSGSSSRRETAADAIVIGAGLVGLATADALAARGARVILLDEERSGTASVAAAGMLAPTVEPIAGPALEFAIAARDRFAGFLESLESDTNLRVPAVRGIVELAHTAAQADRLRATTNDVLQWLEPGEVASLEPALDRTAGGVLHPQDGAVDNVALLAALGRRVDAQPLIRRVAARARRLERTEAGGAVHVECGGSLHIEGTDVPHMDGAGRLEARAIVLAAGAWCAMVQGLPRPLPVVPYRGQMIAFESDAVRRVIFSDAAYLVPRGSRLLVGATMEDVGFDDATTPEAQESLRAAAIRLVPSLHEAPLVDLWAGLRPMSPDGLPILGRDPGWPSLLYACGHSRNGILMAPLTGECLAAIALGEEPPVSLAAFDVRRFDRGGIQTAQGARAG